MPIWSHIGHNGKDARRLDRPGGQPLQAFIRAAICCTGLPRLMRYAHSRDAAIVAYHGVIPDELWRGWIMSDMIPLSLFRRQLRFYRRHYNVITLRQLVSGLDSPGRHLPPRSLAITFDDGFRNNLRFAMPALTEANLPASFFVTTGFIDGQARFWWLRLKEAFAAAMGRQARVRLSSDLVLPTDNAHQAYMSYKTALAVLKTMPAAQRDEILDRLSAEHPMSYETDVATIFEPMSWAEVDQAHRMGFEIGAHTVSHPILSQETSEVAANEIRESVRCLRRHLGAEEMAFSYPNGQWSDFTIMLEAVMRDAGCYCAVTSVPGTNGPGEDPYALRRLPISGLHSLPAVELETCRLNDLLHRARHMARYLPRRKEGSPKLSRRAASPDAGNGGATADAAPVTTTTAAIDAETNIIWGDDVDGLRLGVAAEPIWPGEPPRETLGAVLHVQNMGPRKVTLRDRIIGRRPLPRLVDFSLSLIDPRGQRMHLSDVLPSGEISSRQLTLLPSESRPLGVVLLAPLQRKTITPAVPKPPATFLPVNCRIVASYRFGENGHSDWSGTLTAGEVSIKPLMPQNG